MSEHARAVFRWWPLGMTLVFSELGGPLDAAVKVKVGNEFQVNSFTTSYQDYADVAMDGDGDFVVVWESNNQDGDIDGIFVRRFDSAGQRLAVEFQVNQRTTLDQQRPVIAVAPGGGFVVAWESYQQDGSQSGVFARRFDSAGQRLAVEFQVNTYTSGSQYTTAISMHDDGSFVVAWQSNAQDGNGHGVFARRFTSSGIGLAVEFQVNTYTPQAQRHPSVGVRGDHGFVMVWHSYKQDYISFGVFGRRFDSSGVALASEFQVAVRTSNFEFYPRVAIGPMDDFVVAWESFVGDGNGRGLSLRRFDSSGSALGGEIQVNSYTTDFQDSATIAIAGDGSFVIAWQSYGQDGEYSGVFGQSFDQAANRHGPEFQITTRTASGQSEPTAAIDGDGDLVVVWQSGAQDGDGNGVFAQRFADVSTLDFDADGEIEPLTDGLLFLRWTFGFSGPTLTTGAVDLTDCGRCGAQEIADHFQSVESLLDVDGSNVVDALTDGLLILRWLFGFTGGTLITGAVDTVNCSRCTAPEVEAYLMSL